MSTDKTTCGELFSGVCNALKPACSSSFWVGYVTGLAEKVYLGACMAAEISPPSTQLDECVSIVGGVCDVYDLRYCFLFVGSSVREIWMFRNDDSATYHRIDQLSSMAASSQENSANWHRCRAILTGVRIGEIDYQYHKRTVVAVEPVS